MYNQLYKMELDGTKLSITASAKVGEHEKCSSSIPPTRSSFIGM